jgi:immune inhibitor A
VRRFTDAIGWYPGYEYRPDLNPDPLKALFFRDVDASVVIPSKGNQIYTTRITDKNGRLLRSQFGRDLGNGHVAGTGNPRDGTPDNPTDLSLGVKLRVERASSKAARVVVRPGHRIRP